jgi:diguanylate cyclase (GGDEF)-like protein
MTLARKAFDASRGPLGLGPRVEYLGRLAIVTAAYFGCAKAGLAFAFANQSVTSVWPPTGLALAAVLVWGYRMWPAVTVGAFLANITTAGPLLSVSGIAAGNTLEAVLGAYLLRRLAGFRPSLERVSDVVALVVYGAAISTTVAATIGVISLSAAGLIEPGQTLSTWRVWWLGDAGGDLIVAPALLVLASRPRLQRRPWIRAEAVLSLVLLCGVSLVALESDRNLTYLVFPILFYIATRFRQPGTVIAGLIVSGIAVWFTSRGHGPFIGGSADAELLRAQTFVGIATITGLVVAALVMERGEIEKQLRRLADHDPLTGLFNRRRFAEELERWIAYSSRYGGGGAVLVMDVDDLKRVNDVLGHAAGDDLLVRVARLLAERLRETDVVARLGGDEFIALLPSTDEHAARRVANSLLDQVRDNATMPTGDGGIQTTLSIGVASFGEGVKWDPDRILARADRAMYLAKAAGRDQVQVDSATHRPPTSPPPDGAFLRPL